MENYEEKAMNLRNGHEVMGQTKNLKPEILLVIYKYLISNGFHDAAQMIHTNFDRNQIARMRIDWDGNIKNMNFSEMVQYFNGVKNSDIGNLFDGIFEILGNHPSQSYLGLSSLLSNKFPSRSSIRSQKLRMLQKSMTSSLYIRKIMDCSRSMRKSSMVQSVLAGISMKKRIHGHLASTYCVIFDRTGSIIITGSDDKLIKIWDAHYGKLIATLRGHTAQVCDLAISPNNTLIASGSCDRTVRVWSAKTAAELYILHAHTGSVTSVAFSPYMANNQIYLISTGNDALLCFWSIVGQEVDPEPTKFSEKIKPSSHLVCSSFSPGGTLLVVGSTDSHIYVFKIDKTITEVADLDLHTERVDSVQFSHSGERFISGSNDGTARVWSPRNSTWTSLPLPLSLPNENEDDVSQSRKIRILSISWNDDDRFVIGSVTDFSLRVWCSTSGNLLNVFRKHTDSVYIIESFRTMTNHFLSAGHDGRIIIWNIFSTEPVLVLENQLEDLGPCAIFDAKISPNELLIAATDISGSVCIFGYGSDSAYSFYPYEQFFHTDYRPIIVEGNHTIDEQQNLQPHLMPPPYFVTGNGRMHSRHLQALHLGRVEHPYCLSIQTGGQEGSYNVQPLHGEASTNSADRSEDFYSTKNISGDWRRWKGRQIIPQLSSTDIKVGARQVAEINSQEKLFYENLRLCSDPLQVTKDERMNKLLSLKSRAIQTQLQLEHAFENDSIVLEESTTHVASEEESSFHSENTTEEEYTEDSVGDNTSIRREICTRRNRYVAQEFTPEDTETESEDDTASHSSGSKESETDESQISSKLVETRTLLDISRDWIHIETPTRSPYFPQLGDIVVYHLLGHKEFVKYIATTKLFYISPNKLCYNKTNLKSIEICRVMNLTFSQYYPFNANIVLTKMDSSGTFSTGVNFTVQYTDLPNMDDFIILKQFYDDSVRRKWRVNQTIHSYMDDRWYDGTITAIRLMDEAHPESLYHNIHIKWQSGEEDVMSPWDVFPSICNLSKLVYRCDDHDWFPETCSEAAQRILTGFETVRLMPQFNEIEEILIKNAQQLQFPTSYEKIVRRCTNLFYRRKKALIWEIRMIKTILSYLRVDKTIIEANQFISRSIIAFIKDVKFNIADVVKEDDSCVETSNESEDDDNRTNTDIPIELQWAVEAKKLLDEIMVLENAQPFLEAVDLIKYPDYLSFVKKPMDFSLISTNLASGVYINPDQFVNDMRLIVSNSRMYNTNPRSAIYGMTLRLNTLMTKKMEGMLPTWRKQSLDGSSHITRNKINKFTKILESSTSRALTDLDISSIHKPSPKKKKRRKPIKPVSSRLRNIIEFHETPIPRKRRRRPAKKYYTTHVHTDTESSGSSNSIKYDLSVRSKRRTQDKTYDDISEISIMSDDEIAPPNKRYKLRSSNVDSDNTGMRRKLRKRRKTG